MFDFLVIGKGLIGSAAARYLSQASANIAIIGPDEPVDAGSHDGVFASHYDQGRVTRKLSKNPVWSELARRSIEQYGLIEEQSGIRFHQPVGCMRVLHKENFDKLLSNFSDDQKYNIPFQTLEDMGELRKRFPFLDFPDEFVAVLEPAPTGYINPLELIQAQLTIAKEQGTSVIKETVMRVEAKNDIIYVRTKEGNDYKSKKLLIATGAFANCFDILEQKLELRIKSETTLLARVSEQEATRLSTMPSVLYDFETSNISGGYMLPPIRYPDEQIYVKLGCNTVSDQNLSDLAAMREWIMSGDSNVKKDAIKAMLLSIIPNLNAESFETRRCLVTYTPQGYPFIDAVSEQVFVAVAGNGSAAKSSDAIGALAARLVQAGRWEDGLDAGGFKVSYKSA